MDPQACLWKFLYGDHNDRIESSRDYAVWVAKGGFRAVVMFDGKRREVVSLTARTLRVGFLASNDATDRARGYADIDRSKFARCPLLPA